MVKFSVEHVLLFVVAAFLLYHLMGSCGCGDGFSVGGLKCDNFTSINKKECYELKNRNQCHKHKYVSRNPETRQDTDYRCLWGEDEKCYAMTNYMSMCDPPKPIGSCKGTEFGCCLDGVTPASSDNDECNRKHKCSNALKNCTNKCKNHKHHKHHNKCMNNCFQEHKHNCKKKCNNKNKDKKHECNNKCNQDCKPLEPIPLPRTDGGADGACFNGKLNDQGGMPGGKCLGQNECCSMDGFCGEDDKYCLNGYCNTKSDCGPYNCMNNTCKKIF